MRSPAVYPGQTAASQKSFAKTGQNAGSQAAAVFAVIHCGIRQGDKMALLTVEQRYFTDWYPWRLFRLGGAVLVDLGRACGDAPIVRSENGLLMNVGVGLRVGNTRSGLERMTHIDIALPLDGGSDIKSIQFLVATEKCFQV